MKYVVGFHNVGRNVMVTGVMWARITDVSLNLFTKISPKIILIMKIA